MLHPCNIFADTRNTETPLCSGNLLTVENLDFRINQNKLAPFAFRKLLPYRVGVNYYYAVIAPYLRSGKPYPLGCIHGLKHVCDKFLEFRIFRRHILALAPEHRMSVKIYR